MFSDCDYHSKWGLDQRVVYSSFRKSLIACHQVGKKRLIMTTATVSVIVPIYNVEKYLEQCLDSILDQSHRDLELICINDGSTDGSPAILGRYASKDDRVRVINKENGGYGAACNLGLREAHGDWISIIEPDDWIGRDMYRDMLELAKSAEVPIDIVKTPWIDVRDWDDPAKQHCEPSIMVHRFKTSSRPFTLADEPALIESHPSIWSAIYRADFLRKKGVRFVEYPGAGWADNPFLIEAFCQAGSIMYLDQAYYYYRCDLPGSTRNHGSDDAIARPFERWLDMLAIIKRLGVTDRGILQAHYLRGFNYVQGAIFDDGWDNELVRKKTGEVFEAMDPDIVASCAKVSAKRKAFYSEVTGRKIPTSVSLARFGYLTGEAMFSLRRQGVKGFLGRVKRLAFGKIEESYC